MIRLPEDAVALGKIARAQHEQVDTLRGSDRVLLLDRLFVLDDHGDNGLAVGVTVILRPIGGAVVHVRAAALPAHPDRSKFGVADDRLRVFGAHAVRDDDHQQLCAKR